MMTLSNEIIDYVNYMGRDEKFAPSFSAAAESGILGRRLRQWYALLGSGAQKSVNPLRVMVWGNGRWTAQFDL
jgi:hypothetical protein